MDIQNEVIQLSLKNNNIYNIVFEVTTNCNWKCKHCYVNDKHHKNLSIEQIYDVFSQMRSNGVFELTLTGGELFTRNDALDIIRKAREMHFKLTLFTNISLLNEKMISELATLYISEISCTIFSLKPNVHDYITGVEGSLEKTIENAMLIKKYKIPLTVKCILTNVNYDHIDKLEAFCDENKFAFKLDHDIFSKKDGDDSPCKLRMTTDQYMLSFIHLDEMRGFKPRRHSADELVCTGIQNALFIDNDAIVYPCNKFLSSVGDLNEKSLSEIWEHSKELKKLQQMRWDDLRTCNSCENEAYCIHCPGTAMLEDGDAYGCSTMAFEKAKIRKVIYHNSNVGY